MCMYVCSAGSSSNYWIGLLDDFDEDYWVWYESNAPYCYEKWNSGTLCKVLPLMCLFYQHLKASLK